MEQDKFVINIGRQLGSGGKAVGEALGRRLGVHVYDKQLINLAAEQSGLCTELFEQADEKKSRSLFSSLIGYLRMPFGGDECGMTDVLSSEALFKIQSDVIRDIASRESCIFVGRCADYILRDHPRAVNVFVTGAPEDRVRRLCEQENVTPEEAEAQMERTELMLRESFNAINADEQTMAEALERLHVRQKKLEAVLMHLDLEEGR